jgi:hypothetical protein
VAAGTTPRGTGLRWTLSRTRSFAAALCEASQDTACAEREGFVAAACRMTLVRSGGIIGGLGSPCHSAEAAIMRRMPTSGATRIPVVSFPRTAAPPWLVAAGCVCAVWLATRDAAGEPPGPGDVNPPAAARPRARQMDPPAEPKPEAAAAGKTAFLGITMGPVSEDLRAHAELPAWVALVITSVTPGSPAEKAGLRLHDILFEFDGRQVASPLEFTEMVEAAGAGRRVTLEILRRGKRQTVAVVLGARDKAAGGDAAAGRMRAPGLPGLPGGLGGDVRAQAEGAIARALEFAQAGGGSSVQVRSSVINGVAEHSAVARDRDGTIEIEARAGRKKVAIRAADGREIHAGPLDAKADYDAVPEGWRERVRALDERVAAPRVPKEDI